MLRFLAAIALLAFTVYCLIDVARTRSDRMHHLPKAAWLVLALLFPPVGGIAWLVWGRPNGPHRHGGSLERGPRGPDDDPDFLHGI